MKLKLQAKQQVQNAGPLRQCKACKGTMKCWKERDTGVYSMVQCRWCTDGMMSHEQEIEWEVRNGTNPYVRKASQSSGTLKSVR